MQLSDQQRDGLATVADRFGTPSFVYDLSHVADRVASLRSAFGDRFEISYAVKSNPNRALLGVLSELVDRWDLSSGGELLLAEETSMAPSTWSFVGPAKRPGELRLALELGCGHIVVESERELRQVDDLARQRGETASVLVRINPTELPKGFGVSMSRRPTIFGIDEEEIDAAIELAGALESVTLDGFHVYAGTQCLDPVSLAENLTNIANLYHGLIERHGLTVDHLVFGSGFGIAYHHGSETPSPDDVASACVDAIDALAALPGCANATMALEMGRFLVGEAGSYLTRVLGTKTTRGTSLVALDGGMNHYLGASGNLGGVLKRPYPVEAVTTSGDDGESYDLSGPLCTNIDSLGRGVEISSIDVGDLVAIGCAGAYGVTSSPVHFISHAPPREIIVDSLSAPDTARDVTASGTLATPIDWERFADR